MTRGQQPCECTSSVTCARVHCAHSTLAEQIEPEAAHASACLPPSIWRITSSCPSCRAVTHDASWFSKVLWLTDQESESLTSGTRPKGRRTSGRVCRPTGPTSAAACCRPAATRSTNRPGKGTCGKIHCQHRHTSAWFTNQGQPPGQPTADIGAITLMSQQRWWHHPGGWQPCRAHAAWHPLMSYPLALSGGLLNLHTSDLTLTPPHGGTHGHMRHKTCSKQRPSPMAPHVGGRACLARLNLG